MAISEADKAAAHARQQKRYRDQIAAKQFQEREHLRGEIPSRRLVNEILQIGDLLLNGREQILTESGEVISLELDRTRQNGLKAAAEIRFKLLNKTIPDLKQIELRADVTEEALPTVIEYHVVKPVADE